MCEVAVSVPSYGPNSCGVRGLPYLRDRGDGGDVRDDHHLHGVPCGRGGGLPSRGGPFCRDGVRGVRRACDPCGTLRLFCVRVHRGVRRDARGGRPRDVCRGSASPS